MAIVVSTMFCQVVPAWETIEINSLEVFVMAWQTRRVVVMVGHCFSYAYASQGYRTVDMAVVVPPPYTQHVVTKRRQGKQILQNAK